MKISIAMATFNGAKYIQEQLNSFAAQTRLPDELVISDDGSRDDTLAIIEKFAQTVPFPVRCLANEGKKGFAQNFNTALMHCSGDLIFISDQDDYWLPEKIQTITDIAAQDPHHDVFMNDAELTDSALTRTGLTIRGQIRSAGRSDHAFLLGCCIAVRESFLSWILPIPQECRAHDNWIVEFADGLGLRRIIDQPLQLYRRHSRTTTTHDITQPRPVNRLASLRGRLLANIRNHTYARNLAARKREIQLMADRARAYRNEGEDAASSFEQFIGEMTRQGSTIDVRLRLLRAARMHRILPITNLLLTRRYAYFRGVWTALQDFLMPKQPADGCSSSDM